MKIDKKKFDIVLATKCLGLYELCEKSQVSRATLARISHDKELKPETVGKIAKALKTPVTDII
jgi:DNA-binding Xre family transcriptional regulator